MRVNYFVDESGDDTIFSKKGRVIIGQNGNSRFFIMGLLQVNDPDSLSAEMTGLRTELVNDPYFKNVPSMRPESRKTALAFHAKDDLPEARREVYKLLKARSDLKFYAMIGDKTSTLQYVAQMQARDTGFHYHKNDMYDYLVRRLFRDRLTKADEYSIIFAERGNKKRTAVLKAQVDIAQQRHLEKFGGNHCPPCDVDSGKPKDYAGLQAVDYFLWGLQRLYERKEERYILNVWEHCKLIIDMDDRRRKPYGEYYHKSRPLTFDALKERF